MNEVVPTNWFCRVSEAQALGGKRVLHRFTFPWGGEVAIVRWRDKDGYHHLERWLGGRWWGPVMALYWSDYTTARRYQKEWWQRDSRALRKSRADKVLRR